jgi:hypothetical protein
MTLAFIVYLISFVSVLSNTLVVVDIISMLVLIATFIMITTEEDYSWDIDRNGNLKQRVLEFRKNVRKAFKISGITMICCIICGAIIPNEKTAWLMVGAYVGQQVAENEKVQELSGKVLTIIEKKLDAYIMEKVEK